MYSLRSVAIPSCVGCIFNTPDVVAIFVVIIVHGDWRFWCYSESDEDAAFEWDWEEDRNKNKNKNKNNNKNSNNWLKWDPPPIHFHLQTQHTHTSRTRYFLPKHPEHNYNLSRGVEEEARSSSGSGKCLKQLSGRGNASQHDWRHYSET